MEEIDQDNDVKNNGNTLENREKNVEGEELRQNCRRTALEPIDETLNVSRVTSRTREAHLDDLIRDRFHDMNFNHNYANT